MVSHGMSDTVVTAKAAARGLGMTLGTLRVWRHRNPGVLPIVARDRAGEAIYRWADVERVILLRGLVTPTVPRVRGLRP